LKKKLKQWKTTVNKPARPSLGVNNLQRGQEKALEAVKELEQTAPVKEGMPAPGVPAIERQPPKLVPALGAQKDTQPGRNHRDLQREQNLPVQTNEDTTTDKIKGDSQPSRGSNVEMEGNGESKLHHQGPRMQVQAEADKIVYLRNGPFKKRHNPEESVLADKKVGMAHS
jgi:hypothetical protein